MKKVPISATISSSEIFGSSANFRTDIANPPSRSSPLRCKSLQLYATHIKIYMNTSMRCITTARIYTLFRAEIVVKYT